jgi:hypothetical protein
MRELRDVPGTHQLSAGFGNVPGYGWESGTAGEYGRGQAIGREAAAVALLKWLDGA